MISQSLIDYEKCHEYARALCGQRGIPPCDVADIGSDTFLLALRRSWRSGDAENDAAAANRLMYTSALNVIARRNMHASRILREADVIVSATADEPSDDDEADGTDAAADWPVNAVPAQATVDDDWQYPLWRRLFDNERQILRNERRKSPLADRAVELIKFGLKDSRLSLIQQKMKVSGRQFQTFLKFFRMRFALCFQALREFRDRE